MGSLLFITFAILFIIIFTAFVIYNGIISSRNTVEESFSAIDTILQQRYDLIPNLVEVVKQYASHEKDTLEKVTQMRSNLINNSGQQSESRFENENMLSSSLKSIFALSENYPDLKASENFISLQNEWSNIENSIQAARRAYNAAVKDLKNKKEMFPSNIVAGFMSLKDYTMYLAQEEAKTVPNAKALFNS